MGENLRSFLSVVKKWQWEEMQWEHGVWNCVAILKFLHPYSPKHLSQTLFFSGSPRWTWSPSWTKPIVCIDHDPTISNWERVEYIRKLHAPTVTFIHTANLFVTKFRDAYPELVSLFLPLFLTPYSVRFWNSSASGIPSIDHRATLAYLWEKFSTPAYILVYFLFCFL